MLHRGQPRGLVLPPGVLQSHPLAPPHDGLAQVDVTDARPLRIPRGQALPPRMPGVPTVHLLRPSVRLLLHHVLYQPGEHLPPSMTSGHVHRCPSRLVHDDRVGSRR